MLFVAAVEPPPSPPPPTLSFSLAPKRSGRVHHAGGSVPPGNTLRQRLRGVHEEDGDRGRTLVRRSHGVGPRRGVRAGLPVYCSAKGAAVSFFLAFAAFLPPPLSLFSLRQSLFIQLLVFIYFFLEPLFLNLVGVEVPGFDFAGDVSWKYLDFARIMYTSGSLFTRGVNRNSCVLLYRKAVIMWNLFDVYRVVGRLDGMGLGVVCSMYAARTPCEVRNEAIIVVAADSILP